MPELVYSSHQSQKVLDRESDAELLARLGEGDDLALDALIDRKTGPLLQAVRRIVNDEEEAKDIVQVTFLRIWENRAKYDSRWAPNTWIFRIATNLAIDQLRARRSKDRQTEPMKWHLRSVAESGGQSQHRELQGQEVRAIFEDLAVGLSEKQRAVFLLREIEGLTSVEVAEVLGCRHSTVRNHLFNARKILRRELALRFPEYDREEPRP